MLSLFHSAGYVSHTVVFVSHSVGQRIWTEIWRNFFIRFLFPE